MSEVRIVSTEHGMIRVFQGEHEIKGIMGIEFEPLKPQKPIFVKLTLMALLDITATAEIDTQKWVLVNTDNFGSDYPDERFLTETTIDGKPPNVREWDDVEAAANCARNLNKNIGVHSPRYWKVEKLGYKLQGGFEP